MKFLDLAPNRSGESENWPTNAVFHAEQEYTNEKHELARFSLKFFKSVPTRIKNTRPQKSAPTLPLQKK